ncbi:hypothetical protein ANMWB30_24480 [Arthrobacter sp. MWB30]|nr:hypothetical protein ANMWB30_24480 [Arthrobacter sp. MWB30]
MTMPRSKPTTLMKATLAALALLASTTACAGPEASSPATNSPGTSKSQSPKPESLGYFQLVRVIDGDTIELKPGTASKPTDKPAIVVRILGMKAPDLTECGGPEAKAELERITQGGSNFEVVFDQRSAHQDPAGNVQGYVYDGAGSGTPSDVADTMIRNGYGNAWFDPSDVKPEKYSQLQKLDESIKDRGLHKICESFGS